MIGPSEAPELVLKHSINIYKPHKVDEKWEYQKLWFEYQTNEDQKNNLTNLYLGRITSFLLLESKKYLDNNNRKLSYKIYQKDFIELKRCLNNVIQWFKNDLYKTDRNGSIIELKEEYNELISICFSKFVNGLYLSFQPSLAFDNNYSYPGILINTNNGTLGSISYDEFLLLKINLEEYINNFNLFTNQLLSIAYLQSKQNEEENPTIL